MGIKIDCERIGSNGQVRLSITDNGAPVFADTLDPTLQAERARFVERVLSQRPELVADEFEAEVCNACAEPETAAEPARGTVEYRLTDIGNGERLAARHGDDLRYCWPWKKWLVWDAQRWKVDDTGAVVTRAKRTVQSIYAEAAECDDKVCRKAVADWAKLSERRERLSAMIDLARSEPGIPILPDALDRDPWALNCPNGTVDLRSGELRKHRREDYITKLCPTRYDPAAHCPTWEACLRRIFADNAKLIAFLQRLLGYCATGSVRDHVLPICWGLGANGKSTILGAVMEVLGTDYASKAPPELLMMRRGEHHPTERADLFGKRLVVAVETQEGGRLNEALIKDLTGGDRQKARRMREDFWEFAPTHKLILATNHKPVVKDTTHSTWRRVKLIPFEVIIPEQEQDAKLPDKLQAEREGILRWIVAGCLEWQRVGLAEPDVVKVATREYRSEEDIIGAFLDDCCRLDPPERERASTLYGTYRKWCERGGERPINQTRFGKALTERGLHRDKANVVWYVGVALEATDFD